MKRLLTLPAIIVVLSLLASCAAKPTPAPTPTPVTDLESAAKTFVTLLRDGKYAEATQMFDPQMAAAFPTSKMQATWEGLVQQAGAFKEIKGVKMADEGGYRIAYVTCDFAQTPLDLKVVFGKDGRISGLWFVPAGSGGT